MSLFLAEMRRLPRILIVGDAMVDRYVVGEVTRLSPEAPVPVLLTHGEDTRPGGAANVAANVVAMGGTCELLCISGDDGGRRDLEKLMTAAGVELNLVVDPEQVTTQKTRLVSGVQQIARIDRDGNAGPNSLTELESRFEAAAERADLILLSDYGKGTLGRLPRLLAKARQLQKQTLVDPKKAGAEHYRGSFLLKPNALEFNLLFGPCAEADLVEHARAALRAYDIEHMILTRGPKGMLLVSADGSKAERPTDALEVFDVSGAGDTVLAALGLTIAGGLSLARAMELANVAAGIAVSHTGTYVVSARDIDRRLAQARLGGSKVVPPEALAPLLDGQRRRGARIVFTNGCFDVLHPGHVRMLQAAKAEGDVLVLGLNEDASVARLKGAGRPVNGFADRAEVLAALSCVDYVVGFADDTPLELIRTVQPDVLVKGGDYVPENIVGFDVVTSRGGRVVAVDFHQGHSTTATIQKLAAAN